MGRLKHLQELLSGGNPLALEDRYVCADCIGDDALKGVIESEASECVCSFCGEESDRPIAAPLLEVVLYMNECLERDYGAAENWLSFDEGEYQGRVWTTDEVLGRELDYGLPNDDNGELMKALCDGLGGRAWCRAHPYSLTQDEQLAFSWGAFCELIKHERRYFFLREPANDGLFSAFGLLRELGSWCERFGLISALQASTLAYRARYQGPGEKHHTAGTLGPPPRDRATKPNRMSPSGIVMFYASDDAETALREVAKDPETDAGSYALGRFRTQRDVHILDLTRIPPVPSIFESIPESLEYDPRPPLKFLNYFAFELSKPITPDDSTHVEYIPSQVVTEYFRTAFVRGGTTIEGIRYHSARHDGGYSLVLFASQSDLVAGEETIPGFPLDRDPWIELVDRSEREVSRHDLERWDREAPRPFDWLLT